MRARGSSASVRSATGPHGREAAGEGVGARLEAEAAGVDVAGVDLVGADVPDEDVPDEDVPDEDVPDEDVEFPGAVCAAEAPQAPSRSAAIAGMRCRAPRLRSSHRLIVLSIRTGRPAGRRSNVRPR